MLPVKPSARLVPLQRRAPARKSGTLKGLVHLLAYVVATVAPFFATTASLARTGVTLVASVPVTVLVERDTLTSVWCFFAAILSGLMVIAVSREQRSNVTSLAAHSHP